MYLEYKNQPGNISKSSKNPIQTSYAIFLQKEAENGLNTKNIATSRQLKRNVVVIYDAQDKKDFYYYHKERKKPPNNNEIETNFFIITVYSIKHNLQTQVE